MRRWQIVIIWISSFFITAFVLDGLGFSDGVIKSTLIGMMLSTFAYLSKSQYWQYLINKDLNPFAKTFGKSTVPRPVEKVELERPIRLNTPVKRLWFLTFIAGLAICGITFVIFNFDNPNRDFLRIFHYSNRYGIYKAMLIFGLMLTTFGLIFSLFYDQLLGRLISWVRGNGAS